MSLLEECCRRIIATRVGSLPRPESLSRFRYDRMTHQPYDGPRLGVETRDAVHSIIRQQISAGIDIISDGEQGGGGWQMLTSTASGGRCYVFGSATTCAVNLSARK